MKIWPLITATPMSNDDLDDIMDILVHKRSFQHWKAEEEERPRVYAIIIERNKRDEHCLMIHLYHLRLLEQEHCSSDWEVIMKISDSGQIVSNRAPLPRIYDSTITTPTESTNWLRVADTVRKHNEELGYRYLSYPHVPRGEEGWYWQSPEPEIIGLTKDYSWLLDARRVEPEPIGIVHPLTDDQHEMIRIESQMIITERRNAENAHIAYRMERAALRTAKKKRRRQLH